MVRPKNPFKKWIAIQKNNKVKFFLCTFQNEKIHAATCAITTSAGEKYYIKKTLFENYPMLLEYIGEPSLYSHSSVENWLQSIIQMNPEAFKLKGIFLVISI